MNWNMEQHSSWWRFHWPALLALIFLGVATGLAYFAYRDWAWKPMEGQKRLANVLFRRINFERFVLAGNLGLLEDSPRKVLCLHLSGEASVAFDLRRLRRERRGGRWVAVYTHPEATEKGLQDVMPFLVDVRVDPTQVQEVLSISPKILSDTAAGQVTSALGVIAGLGGAYVGAKAGAGIGSTIFRLPVGGLAGAGIGGLLGGAALGSGGYVLTRRFVSGLQLSGPLEQRHKDEILEQAKALIAAELLFDNELVQELTAEFRIYAKALYGQWNLPVAEVLLSDKPLPTSALRQPVNQEVRE